MKVFYNKPSIVGKEIKYIYEAIRKVQLSGDGFFTNKCSKFLENYLGVQKVLLTPSCTHALELAFLMMRIEPGDEAIVPSFTFPSTVNAFVLRGAKPRFVDIREDTLNINENLIEGNIRKKTKAIVPVHYAGVPCQMDVIRGISRKHKIPIVEDAAQALGATFKGEKAGSMGDFNAFSFHETKNCISGEGGALVIKNRRDVERAEILRQKGTNRNQFYQGKVNYYSWVDMGSSYVPSELQTAFLFGQLEHFDRIMRKRKSIFDRYFKALNPYQKKGQVRLPYIPPGCHSSYHIFYLLFGSKKERDRILAGLYQKGILGVPHYFPLHLSTMGKKYGYKKGDLPVTEKTAETIVRLPFYFSMTDKEQSFVIKTLVGLLKN